MFIVNPSKHLHGTVHIPPSKSHTLRAILWASLAHGSSTIQNYLHSPDTDVLLHASQQLGCHIDRDPLQLIIRGTHKPTFPQQSVVHTGSSGIAFRFLTALAAVHSKQIMISGDVQLQRRPIRPLIQALSNLGAQFHLPDHSVLPPFFVSGPLSSGHTHVDGSDSQYASACMIACSLTPEPCSFQIINPKELPWIRLSTWWLHQVGIQFSQPDSHTYVFPGNQRPTSYLYSVTGDFSSAAFIAAAGLLSASPFPTTLKNLYMNDIQGDKNLFLLLQQLGARIHFEDKQILVFSSSFQGGEIDMDPYIDALPILAVLCCFAQTTSRLYNAASAKNKECNRIVEISNELQKMGANIYIDSDSLIITPAPLHGAELDSHGDHRIAMALTIAALYASGTSIIHNTQCVKKTFPYFVSALHSLHGDIREVE